MVRYPLPSAFEWSFEEIAAAETDRAARLEEPLSPTALIAALLDRLRTGLGQPGKVFLAQEFRGEGQNHPRAVIQFAVGSELFDQFFNARSGYRAHYRAHYKRGLRFNNALINAVHGAMAEMPDLVEGRWLGHPAKDLGPLRIQRDLLLQSLEPCVAKIWWCADRFRPGGGIDPLPFGVTGPRLLLGDTEWNAPYRDEEDAWLEVKGRFLGLPRWDQGKKLILDRSKGISADGTA